MSSKHRQTALLAFLVLVARNPFAWSQCGEEASDHCQDPRPLPGVFGEFDLAMGVEDATSHEGELCGVPAGHTVWFSLIPEETGTFRFSTCHPVTSYDTVVQVFRGGDDGCEFMEPIGCEDDSVEDDCATECGGRGATLELEVVADEYYRFVVGSKDSNAAGCELCLGVRVHLSPPIVVEPTPQVIALRHLEENSLEPPSVHFRRGVPCYISTATPVQPDLPEDPVVRSLSYLERYRDLYRFAQPLSDLYLKRLVHNEDNREWHLFFGQHHDGVPVFASEITVHLEDDLVRGTNGMYLPSGSAGDLELPGHLDRTAPLLQKAAAIRRAEAHLGGIAVGEPWLTYYNGSLFSDRENRTFLAWRIHLKVNGAPWLYLLDARTGDLLFRLEEAMPADRPGEDFDIETANNTSESTSCWLFTYDDDQWFDEDGVVSGATPDTEGWNVYDYTHKIYHYFYDKFGRKSYDGDEEDIEIYLDVNFSGGANARYCPCCDIFEFWDGYGVLDVVTHEITHGVTMSTAELVYSDQPGALNESFSDVFAALVDDKDWTMGEDLPGGSIRDLSNPPMHNQPDGMAAFRSPPAGASSDSSNDWGFVHTNSGIPNKVFYLLTAGGTFRGLEISQLGRSKVEKLYYEVLTEHLNANSQFIDFRNVLVGLIKKYQKKPNSGFHAYEVCSVINAFASVGLGPADRDCDGIEDNIDLDDDGDKIPDTSDNCPQTANPSQINSDTDALGDACDQDDDNDGILDDGDGIPSNYNFCKGGVSLGCDDNCRTIANSNQADADGDGIGDVCEDDDNDGILTPVDNCPSDANPLQWDQDRDGKGDVCDPDDDNDGVLDDGDRSGFAGDNECQGGATDNCDDNCPYTSNPTQSDVDGDGVGDACDACIEVADATNFDTDADGVGDACDPDDDDDGVCDVGGPLPDGTAGTPAGGCMKGASGKDNCPKTANADQADYFGDGVGDACSQKLEGLPWQALTGEFEFSAPDLPLNMPIGPCGGDCPDWLLDDFVTEIVFETPFEVAAQIVDERGYSVCKDHKGSVKLLRFHPSAAAFYRAPALPGSGAGLEENSPFIGKQYFLQIFPSAEVELGRRYPVTLHIRSGHEQEIIGTEDAPFARGDTNGDLSLDISDPVFLLDHLFLGKSLQCQKSGDINDDGELEITDAIVFLNHMFLGAPLPADSLGECAIDPTLDDLECPEHDPCR